MSALRTAAMIVSLTALAGCPDFTPPPDLVSTEMAPATEGSISGVLVGDFGAARDTEVGIERQASGMWSLLFRGSPSVFGQYSFFPLEFGIYRVRILNLPAGITCEPPLHVVQVTMTDPHPAADFACSRLPESGDRVFVGLLEVAGGDVSHDPFVFDAGNDGRAVEFHVATDGNAITLHSPGLAAFGMPRLDGAINGGAIVASGSGTIAGVGGVSVTATGSIAGDRLTLEIIVGGNGTLPRGTPIIYRFEGTDPLGGAAP